MKSLDQIRDELADENAEKSNQSEPNLNYLVKKTRKLGFVDGFDAAVAHLQSAGRAKFDAEAVLQAMINERFSHNKIDNCLTDAEVAREGARWQFNQMQAERDSLLWEISKLQAKVALGDEQMQAEIERLHDNIRLLEFTEGTQFALRQGAKINELEAQLAKLTDALKEITEADVHYFPDGRVSVAETVLIARKALASLAPNGGENE